MVPISKLPLIFRGGNGSLLDSCGDGVHADHRCAHQVVVRFSLPGTSCAVCPVPNHPAALGISGVANIGPSFVVRFYAVSPCAVLMEVRRKLRSYRGKLRSFSKAQFLSRPCGIRIGRKLHTPFLRTPLRFVFAHSAIAQCGEKCAVPSRPFISDRIPSISCHTGLEPNITLTPRAFLRGPSAQRDDSGYANAVDQSHHRVLR